MAEEDYLEPADVAGTADRFRLDGDVALVTGASQGIGRVTAFALADAGADVAVASRSPEKLEEVAADCRAAFDVDATAIELDVADPAAVEATVETVVDDLGDLDVLVNNAGASFPAATENISPNGWDTVADINLKGTFMCSKQALPHLEGGGRVVNFSSIAGRYGSQTMSHYGAAKAGVENLTRSLAGEWAGRDVRVNCIAPGLVLTPGAAAVAGVGSDTAHDRATVDRPVGSAAEIADAVLYLVAPAASYLTGQTITIEGPPTLSESMD